MQTLRAILYVQPFYFHFVCAILGPFYLYYIIYYELFIMLFIDLFIRLLLV